MGGGATTNLVRGQWLRTYRNAAGLTQEDLAERAGMSARAVQALEAGRAAPRRHTLERLALALNLSAEERSLLLPASPEMAGQGPGAELPTLLTSFIGRSREVEDIVALLGGPGAQDDGRGEVRLITLLGPGGVGKTRLAMQAVEGVRTCFPDGIIVLPLASVAAAGAVLPLVGQALGVQLGRAQSALQSLALAIGERRVLLFLDNLDRLVAAGPDLIALAERCPRLRVLITSRRPLEVRGEWRVAVQPLPLPALDGPQTAAGLDQIDAVRLFVDRGRAVRPGFQLTALNTTAVAHLCRRLDGLPLAIELAAVRLSMFDVATLNARLAEGSEELDGGPRDLPRRQRSLAASLAWSYGLLTPDAAELLRRLSAFTDGCRLEDLLAGCSPVPEESAVLPALEELVANSLVVVDALAGPRYRLLETVATFADAQAAGNGESACWREAFARTYVELAEAAERQLTASNNPYWGSRLAEEQRNFEAVLHLCQQTGDATHGLRLASALWLWWFRMAPQTGLDWSERMLRLPGSVEETAYGGVLQTAAICTWHLGRHEDARRYAEGAIGIARASADDRLLARSLFVWAGSILEQPEQSLAGFQEMMAICQRTGDLCLQAWAHTALSTLHIRTGDTAAAREVLARGRAISQAMGDQTALGEQAALAGFASLADGDMGGARDRLGEALRGLRRVGAQRNVATVLMALGGVELAGGHGRLAARRFREALRISQAIGDWGNVSACVEGLAGVAVDHGDLDRAATLIGVSHGLRKAFGVVPMPTADRLNAGIEEAVRARLPADWYAERIRRGELYPLPAALAYAARGTGSRGGTAVVSSA